MVLLVVLMAGCSARTQVNYGVTAGTSVTQSSVQLNAQGGLSAAALVGLGIIGASLVPLSR
jgi:hypothetical protein